jgi:hypothetical protein
MSGNTRSTILASVGIVLLIGVGVWWYFGFSLDFMKFFAAERTPTQEGPGDTTDRIVTRLPVPEGCTIQQIQCVTTPCDPIISCPRVACVAAQQTVTAGTLVRIQAYGGVGGYAFVAPGGQVAMYDTGGNEGPSNEIGVSYTTPGIKQVLVTSKRSGDSSLTDVAACPVTVIPAAVTN